MCDTCEKTEFGCCTDLENAALGPNFEGCPDEDGSGGFVDCTLTVSTCDAFFIIGNCLSGYGGI